MVIAAFVVRCGGSFLAATRCLGSEGLGRDILVTVYEGQDDEQIFLTGTLSLCLLNLYGFCSSYNSLIRLYPGFSSAAALRLTLHHCCFCPLLLNGLAFSFENPTLALSCSILRGF